MCTPPLKRQTLSMPKYNPPRLQYLKSYIANPSSLTALPPLPITSPPHLPDRPPSPSALVVGGPPPARSSTSARATTTSCASSAPSRRRSRRARRGCGASLRAWARNQGRRSGGRGWCRSRLRGEGGLVTAHVVFEVEEVGRRRGVREGDGECEEGGWERGKGLGTWGAGG